MSSFNTEKVFLFSLVLLLVSVTTTWGHTLGIDFGSEFIKVAGPHNEKSIDIVLNEFSRRKTENVITFRNGDRFIGDSAQKLAARFPLLTVSAINLVMGLGKYSQEFENVLKNFYQNKITFSARGTAEIPISDPHGPFSAEELYSMMLSYLYKISLKDGVTDPKSIVVTIPFNMSIAGRRAILKAAQFSNLNVLGFIHPTTAAAFYYGVRHRGFGNQTRNIVMFDIGATRTEAAMFIFSPCDKTGGLSDSFGTLTSLAMLEDRMLGSRAFDLCLAEIIEQEARKKLKIGPIISNNSEAQIRSRFSLLRAANKARETLSVNTEVPYTVENIATGKDFSSTITRETFETRCSHLFERAKKLALDVISLSGYKASEISAFEMMGGVARTPKIISDLSSAIGRSVNRTLNMDEATALGTAYYAAKLAPFYHTKSLKLVERVPCSVYFFVEPQLNKKTSPFYRVLFESNATIGSSVSITLKRAENFTLTLSSSDLASGVFAKIHVKGVQEALDKLNYKKPTLVHPNNTYGVRIQLRMNESGLVEIEEANAIVKYAVNASQIVYVNVTDTNGTEVIEPNKTFSIQMRHRFAPLAVSFEWLNPRELTDEEALASAEKLYDIEAHEEQKHATAIAKNNLEAYIFWAKGEGVLENTNIDREFDKAALETLNEALNTVYDWLESGHGSMDTCRAEEYIARLNTLKEQVHNATVKPQLSGASGGPPTSKCNDDGDTGDL